MSIRLDTVTALDGLTDRWTELVKQYHTLHALHAIQGKNILRQDIQDQNYVCYLTKSFFTEN